MFLDPQYLTLASLAGSLSVITLFYIFAVLIVHLIMGMVVFKDADKLESEEVDLFLFHPMMWGTVVFVFGLAGIAVYWAVHYSSLRDSRPSGDLSDSDGGS